MKTEKVKQETLLGLAKMGLRTDRKEVFDLAVKRGLNYNEYYRQKLRNYCTQAIFNFKSLEWLYDDKEKYKKFIQHITHLDCSNTTSTNLKGLSKMTHLTHLICVNSGLSSLEGLENLTNLEEFVCYNNYITSLKGIEKLTKLETLDCSHNLITDLKGVEKLESLYKLECNDNKISSFKLLEKIPELLSLSCSDNTVVDFKELEKLTNLEELSFEVDEDGEELFVEFEISDDDSYLDNYVTGIY